MTRVEGSIEATADPLDLDELMAMASAFTSTTGDAQQKRETATSMRLTVALTATKGQFATYTFSDLSTTIALSTGTVTLAPLAVRAFGGQFNGRLETDTRDSAPQLRLRGRVDGLDVAPLMKANGTAGGVTGTLGGTVTLAASGSDAATVLQRAHGTIVAAITNGTIERLDLVRTVVLAFGKPSGAPPEGSGSAFTRLGGTFALARRTLTSDDLSLASRDFDVKGRSTLQLTTGALDARGNVDALTGAHRTSGHRLASLRAAGRPRDCACDRRRNHRPASGDRGRPSGSRACVAERASTPRDDVFRRAAEEEEKGSVARQKLPRRFSPHHAARWEGMNIVEPCPRLTAQQPPLFCRVSRMQFEPYDRKRRCPCSVAI